jgi:hypothetical protein
VFSREAVSFIYMGLDSSRVHGNNNYILVRSLTDQMDQFPFCSKHSGRQIFIGQFGSEGLMSRDIMVSER